MQRVQVFRCIICGDPYIGFEKPANCPLCGAHEQYMAPSAEWRDSNKVNLTEISRKNLEAALELETGDAEFYLCASGRTRNGETRAMFRVLSRAESGHASVICRILGKEKPAIRLLRDICRMDEDEMMREADRKENRAVRLYTEFLSQATEPRVRQLFKALVEIESDHMDIVSREVSEPVPVSKENSGNLPEDDELKSLDKDEIEFYDSYRLHED